MKTRLNVLTVLLFFSAIVLSSCKFISTSNNGIVPSDTYITRNYTVGEFSAIESSTVANIYYTQSKDNTTSLEIYGPDNIVDLMEVAIHENVLILRIKKKVSNVKGMKVLVSTPDLQAIKAKGVGNIYIEEGLTTNSLKVENQGVGNIKLVDLKCKDVTVVTEGVGNVQISGEAVNAVLKSKGVGNLKAESLTCENVEVKSEGIGNITCHATKRIAAQSEGIGNIRYKGNPEEQSIKKSGIGSIKKSK